MTVYTKGRSNGGGGLKVVHTDPDCRYLKQADTVNEYTRRQLSGWYEDCSVCGGSQ